MCQISANFQGWRLTFCTGLLHDAHIAPAKITETSCTSVRGLLAEGGRCGSARGYCEAVRDSEPFFAEEWDDTLLPP